MIKRVAIAIGFAALGFISLLVADTAHSWLCSHLAGFCRSATGPCPDIDVCTPDTLRSIALFAIYFGPALVFGIAGFLFSIRTRSMFSWIALLVGLVTAHSLLMIVVMQAAAELN